MMQYNTFHQFCKFEIVEVFLGGGVVLCALCKLNVRLGAVALYVHIT